VTFFVLTSIILHLFIQRIIDMSLTSKQCIYISIRNDKLKSMMKLFIDKIYAEYYTVRLKVWDKFDYLEKNTPFILLRLGQIR
jgi:hypothetical protein